MASSTFSAEDGPAHLPADTVDGARLRAGGYRGEGGGKGRAGARGRARLWANVDRSRRPRPPACGNESNYFTLRAMGRTRLTRTHDGTTRTTRNFCRNKFEHRGRAYKKPHGRISRRGSQQNRRLQPYCDRASMDLPPPHEDPRPKAKGTPAYAGQQR